MDRRWEVNWFDGSKNPNLGLEAKKRRLGPECVENYKPLNLGVGRLNLPFFGFQDRIDTCRAGIFRKQTVDWETNRQPK